MSVKIDFDALWARHKESRRLGDAVNPQGNRCALVLGATLRNRFKPRPERGELSFIEIAQPPDGIRGQPFLSNYYVRAQQFADRLREEWGQPDHHVTGPDALRTLTGRRGVIFIQDAWSTGPIGALINGNTVDHIDLWNGDTLGDYDAAYSRAAFLRAKFVDLWEAE